MSPPDEDDENAPAGIPSFEDLLEQAVGESGGDDFQWAGLAFDTGPEAGADGTSDFEFPEPSSGFDPSAWEWGAGSEADRPSADEPSGPAAPTNVDQRDGLSGDWATPTAAPLHELTDDFANVLLLGPSGTATDNELCAELAAGGRGQYRRRVLVTMHQSPDERLAALRGFQASPFDETTVIALGDRVRSSAAADATAFRFSGEAVTVETLRDPTDYTRLGLLINKHLADEAGKPAPTVCFHTLSALLELGEGDKLYRFLSVLQGQAKYTGAKVHYHIDPGEVTLEDIALLKQLFEVTVRFDEDGHVSVSS